MRSDRSEKKVMMSWSSGKDSAWALHQLRRDSEFDVVGVFATLNKEYDRVAMHGVRRELLEQQADRLDLPLDVIDLPNPCSNADYEQIMRRFVDRVLDRGITHLAFGDLFLADVRQYREDNLRDTGLTPLFPIWHTPTHELSRDMLDSGLRTMVTCVDSQQIPAEFAGREYTAEFLRDLPESADPCGENGEFHTFVFDGPMFKSPIDVEVGERLRRDQFVFADVLPR